MIDEVVGDLECEADVAGIAAVRRPRVRRQLVHDARRLDRIFDQGAGLELLQPGDRGNIELAAFGGEVHHLAARHSRRAGGAGKLKHQIGAHPRVFVSRGIGENLERQRMQAVAREHRFRLAECLVDGELAAPKLGIVHARQIVMDQRIDMDRLDRAADAKRPPRIDREQARGGNSEQRPKPLAAADRGVAHRFIEALAAVASRREKPRKEAVDLGRDASSFGLQLASQPVDDLNRH